MKLALNPLSPNGVSVLDRRETVVHTGGGGVSGISDFIRTLIDDASAAEARGTLLAQGKIGLTVGPNGDLGCITTGAADEVTVNSAIDSVEAAGGGHVYLQVETLVLEGPIIPKTGVSIFGLSQSGVTLLVNSDYSGAAIHLQDVSDLTINNLSIDGNVGVVGTSFGDNVHNGVTISGNCSNIVIDKVKSFNTGGNGFYSPSTAITQNIVLRDCESDTAGTRGVYFQSDNIKIFGGHFHDSVLHDGVQFEACNNCVVIGVHAYDNGVKGFECQVGATNIQFIGCQAYGNGAGGFEIANGCRFVDVLDSHAYDNEGAGIHLVRESTNSIIDCTVDGNTVYNNGSASGISGIMVQGGIRVHVTNNKVSQSARNGILISEGGIVSPDGNYNCTVTGNKCYNNGRLSATADGINVSTTYDSTFEGNICFDDQGTQTQRYGLKIGDVADTSSGNTVRKNTLSGNLSFDFVNLSSGTIGDYELYTQSGASLNMSTTLNTFRGEKIIFCDGTSNNISIELPSAVGNLSKLTFKKIDSSLNTVTIDAFGTSEKIDGGDNAVIRNQYEAITLISDGANWNII